MPARPIESILAFLNEKFVFKIVFFYKPLFCVALSGTGHRT
jgi:hypothetical protein